MIFCPSWYEPRRGSSLEMMLTKLREYTVVSVRRHSGPELGAGILRQLPRPIIQGGASTAAVWSQIQESCIPVSADQGWGTSGSWV